MGEGSRIRRPDARPEQITKSKQRRKNRIKESRYFSVTYWLHLMMHKMMFVLQLDSHAQVIEEFSSLKKSIVSLVVAGNEQYHAQSL